MTQMTQIAQRALRDLLDLLAVVHGRLRDLAQLASAKLGAIRRADVDEIHQCASAEAAALEALAQLERQRLAVLARLAQALPSPAPLGHRLANLADRLPEPFASALRVRNAALRGVASDLQQKNRLAAAVARGLQSHLHAVFAELAKAATESFRYGLTGKHELLVRQTVLDALG